MKRSSERVRGEAAGAAIQPGRLLIGASIDPGTDEQEATGRGLRHVRVTAEPSGQALEPIMDRIVAGRLEVAVEHTYPLSAAAAAHRAIEERRTTGKLVLVPRDGGGDRAAPDTPREGAPGVRRAPLRRRSGSGCYSFSIT
ncbi:zinc-binding dehydrogenase [Streptomyces canus]|uniref:zinc-binding dehydrogenase n=1 Tax=Streptomyces canus TaxID=58343 RepID=UPI00386AC146|nr:zinc-binding dehydrogenase [Streptomyces canus]